MAFRSIVFDVHAPANAEGDFVVRRGKFFELGEYPDKGFSLNAEEADAALVGFPGAPINLEHMATLFDGKLGKVRRLWREGRDLLAEYDIPAWLHRVTGGEPLRISSEWDRVTKRPIGAALVLSPRIADAVMMAVGESGRDSCRDGDIARRWVKEVEELSLLGRLAAFLRGEGLLEAEAEAGEIQMGEPASTRSGANRMTTDDADPALRANTSNEAINRIRASGAAPEIEGPASSLQFSGSPEFRQMSEMLKEQAAVITGLKAQFAEQQNQATFVSHINELTELVRLGKMTAGESEQWREVAGAHPQAFAAVLATLRERSVLPQFTEQTMRRISPNPEEPAARLIALSKERTTQTGERYETAFSKICRENPELAAAHAASAPRYGGGAHE